MPIKKGNPSKVAILIHTPFNFMLKQKKNIKECIIQKNKTSLSKIAIITFSYFT